MLKAFRPFARSVSQFQFTYTVAILLFIFLVPSTIAAQESVSSQQLPKTNKTSRSKEIEASKILSAREQTPPSFKYPDISVDSSVTYKLPANV
jgi:hypothetical protein